MPEIATAWVTLAASTRGMENDVKRALERAERGAKITPQVDTAGANRHGRDYAQKFSSSGNSGMKSAGVGMGKAFLGGLAGLLAAGGVQSLASEVVDQFRGVFETGLDFSKTLNNFQGVTRATNAQMQAMQSTARALGSDTTLAGASSSDAATAMTELAKAGFSVEESMRAARGTLELATAGQIDASSAAEIQANAMNAFGLGAESAAHTADLLANAAIASSADIPDIGQALQQVGGIAHGFGENLDDTVAALALFANAGIKGSDAGTLLKTTMQSITDQGNPAQGAIQTLGLELYKLNAAGDKTFVGFRDLFRQLGEAKSKMSSEDFQAQTNILFGSDAMRAAMLGNAQDFDTMFTKLQRVGAGAELANAQMQGLPGAVEAFHNTVEGIQLGAFDALGPVVTDKLNMLVQWMSTHQPELIGFFTTLAQTALTTAEGIARFAEGSLNALSVFVDSSAGLFGKALQTLGKFGMGLAGILQHVPGMEGAATAIAKASANAQIYGVTLQGIGDNMRSTADGIGTVADGLGNMSGEIGRSGAQAKAQAEQVRLYKESFVQLSAAVGMVPGSKDIVLKENTPEIVERLRQLGFSVTNLPNGQMTVTLTYRDQNGQPIDPSQLRSLGAQQAVPGEILRPGQHAAGGPIFGPGTGTSDSIPAMLSNGEHVWTASEVNSVGGQGQMYRLRALARKGALRGYAGGGALDYMMLGQIIAPVDPERNADRSRQSQGGGDRGKRGGPWYKGPFNYGGDQPGISLWPGGRGGSRPGGGWMPGNIKWPDWMFPGLNDGDKRIQFYAGGGAAVDGPIDPRQLAMNFAESASGSGYGPSAGPKLWDCSGFMSDIYAILTGKPYAGGERYFTTEADFQALGFVKGFDPNSAFNIGVTAGAGSQSHMAGTLMGYNVESGGGHGGPLVGQGAAGATDSQFAQQYHLPIPAGSYSGSSYNAVSGGGVDPQKVADAEENLREQVADLAIQQQQLNELKADATQSQKMAAEEQVRKATADRDKAARELDDAKKGDPTKAGSTSTGSGGGEDLGQSIISGMLQSLGLDGSVFSNPLEWPNVKSAMAAANWGAGLLQGAIGGDPGGAASGGGLLPNLSLPNIGDLTKLNAPVGTAASGVGAGPAPGPAIINNGTIGMDPRALTQRVDAHQNQAWRKNMSAVRPG